MNKSRRNLHEFIEIQSKNAQENVGVCNICKRTYNLLTGDVIVQRSQDRIFIEEDDMKPTPY